jgi:hypothetical protein
LSFVGTWYHSHETELPVAGIKETRSIIRFRNENTQWSKYNSWLTPTHLFFNELPVLEIKEVFYSWIAKLSSAFLATSVSIENDNIQSLTFSGLSLAKLDSKLPFNWSKGSVEELYLLFEWAYSENASDKIKMVQNIISIDLKQDSMQDINKLLKRIPTIRKVVFDNYKIYLNKTLEGYLNQRQQVETVIKSTIQDIRTQVGSITTVMNTNLLGIIATVITVLIGFTTKAENKTIMPYILYIYGSFSIIVTIYYCVFAKLNVSAIIQNFYYRLNDFKLIFTEERLKEFEGNMIKKQLDIFNGYFVFTFIFNIFVSVIAMILGAYYHFGINTIKWSIFFWKLLFG